MMAASTAPSSTRFRSSSLAASSCGETIGTPPAGVPCELIDEASSRAQPARRRLGSLLSPRSFLTQKSEIALGQLVEGHDTAAARAAEGRHVPGIFRKVLGRVQQLVLVDVTGFADV